MKKAEAIEQLLNKVNSKGHAYSREVYELLERRSKYWNPSERRELWELSQQRKELRDEMLWIKTELEKILWG